MPALFLDMRIENRLVTTDTQEADWALTLAEAKEHLNILDTSFDDLINGYIQSAHDQLWSRCNILISGVYEGYLPCAGDFYVSVYPYSSLTVHYYDTANSLTLMDSSNYIINAGYNQYVELVTAPSTYSRKYPVKVTVTTGSTTNEAIKQGLRMIVGDLFETRQSNVKGSVSVLKDSTVNQLSLISHKIQ